MSTNKEKYKILSAAVRESNFDKIKKLNPSDLRASIGFRLLRIALLKKDLEIAKYFLRHCCKVQITENSKNSTLAKEALRLAVLHGDVEIVKQLLYQGVPIYSKNSKGMTPLHVIITERSKLNNGSIDENFLPIVNCLLDHGADVNEPITDLTSPRNLYTALHLAVESENTYAVSLLLKIEGIIVNAKSKTGLTPLHIAALIGNVKLIKKLLKKGADIQIKNKESKIPLFLAIEKGHSEAIKILLNRTYVKRFLILNRSMYLISAIIGRNKAILESLLQNRADVNTFTKNGTTPLHIAAQEGCEDILRTLLDNGADIYAKRNDGRTSLHLAVEGGHTEIVDILLNHKTDTHADLVKKGIFASGLESDLTPLQIAVAKGYTTITKLLLLHGADIRGTGNSNDSIPLYLATEKGNREAVEVLCEAYSNLDFGFEEANEALYIAAFDGHGEIVKLLLEYGVNPNSKIKSGFFPLHGAIMNGHITIVEHLLENGADANLEFTSNYKNGFRPLHLAAEYGMNEIVELLLRKGAKVNAETPKGAVPLFYAVENQHTGVVRNLLEHGANPNARGEDEDRILHVAIERGNLEIVKSLLNRNIDIEATKFSQTGCTPLESAIMTHNEIIFDLLLKRGAAFDVKGLYDFPLHFAMFHKSYKIAKKLIKYGANVNSHCDFNSTPLIHAIKVVNDSESARNMIKYLLNFGAEVNAWNIKGNTPLHEAENVGDKETVEILLQYDADVNILNKDGLTPLKLAINKMKNFTKGENLWGCVTVAHVITKKIVILEVTGEYVNEENLKLVQHVFLKDFYLSCKQEIEKLKRQKIENDITLYEILTKTHKLGLYVRNKRLIRSVNSLVSKKNFPVFCEVLRRRITEGRERNDLFESSMKTLNILARKKLPFDIVQELFSYLSIKDMNVLSRTFVKLRI